MARRAELLDLVQLADELDALLRVREKGLRLDQLSPYVRPAVENDANGS
jgi:hypothetical protein